MMTNEKVLLCGEQKLKRDLTKEELAEILPDTDPINLTETLKDISDHFIVTGRKFVNIGNPKFEIIPDSRMMPPDGSQFDLDAFVALSRGRIGQISIFVEKDRMGKVFRSGKLYVNQEILSNLLKQEIFAAFKAIMEDFNDI